jgi:hypothetical protein
MPLDGISDMKLKAFLMFSADLIEFLKHFLGSPEVKSYPNKKK